MIDCVVVGGGPAGLAASAALSGRGIAHLVLERGRVGERPGGPSAGTHCG
ncbi:MAG: FAD-dependent monooxygenase [Actinomycetota bacterium]|nr:FAD-dependent monooxygenase [Actinomycetota bacterium]